MNFLLYLIIGSLFFFISCKQQEKSESQVQRYGTATSSLLKSGETHSEQFFNILLVGTHDDAKEGEPPSPKSDTTLVLTFDKTNPGNIFIFSLNRDIGKYESHPNCKNRIMSETYQALGKDLSKYALCVEDMITSRIKKNPNSQYLPNEIISNNKNRLKIHAALLIELKGFTKVVNEFFNKIVSIATLKDSDTLSGAREFICLNRGFSEYVTSPGAIKILCEKELTVSTFKSTAQGFLNKSSGMKDHLENCVKFAVRARGKKCDPRTISFDKKHGTNNCLEEYRNSGYYGPNLHDSCAGYVKEQENEKRRPKNNPQGPILGYAASFQREYYSAKLITEVLGYLAILHYKQKSLYKEWLEEFYKQLSPTLKDFDTMDGIIGDLIRGAAWISDNEDEIGRSRVKIIIFDGSVADKRNGVWGPSGPRNPSKFFVYIDEKGKNLLPQPSGFYYPSVKNLYTDHDLEKFHGIRKVDIAYGNPPWVIPAPGVCHGCVGGDPERDKKYNPKSKLREEAQKEISGDIKTVKQEQKDTKIALTYVNDNPCGDIKDRIHTQLDVQPDDGCRSNLRGTFGVGHLNQRLNCSEMKIKKPEGEGCCVFAYKSKMARIKIPKSNLHHGTTVYWKNSCTPSGGPKVYLACVSNKQIPEAGNKKSTLRGNLVWIKPEHVEMVKSGCSMP